MSNRQLEYKMKFRAKDCPNMDERSDFANQCFALLFRKYSFNLQSEMLLIEARQMYRHFKEYVRNIYEVIDDEIPWMAWVQLNVVGFDETQFDEEITREEYELVLIAAIQEYYN